MDVATRVVRNTGFLYVRIIINIFISLFSTRIVLNVLGVEDFGIYNVIGGVIGMLTFLNSAMTEATQRFMSHAQGEGNIQKQKSIFNVSVILHLAVAIFFLLALEIAGYFLFDRVLEIPAERLNVAKMVYQFMIVGTFFTILKVPFDAVINAHENMLFVAILGIVLSFLKLGIAIYISYTNFDALTLYGLLMAVSYILLMMFTMAYCLREYEEAKLNFRLIPDIKLLKEMGSFAGWSLLNHSAWIITIQGTSIILNSFFGVVVNAAQGIANQITNQLRDFSITMQKALNPVIVKSEGENNRGHMLSTALIGSKFSFFILSFMSIPVLIEMPYILDLWLKDVPDFAVVFCRLNLIRMPVSTLTSTFYVAIGAIGNIKQTAIWESFISICVLPISYLMFKAGMSPSTIYIILLLVAIARSGGRVYFLHQNGGLSIRHFIINVVFRCLGVFIIAFSISSIPLFLKEPSFLRLIIVLFVSAISFIIPVLVFGLDTNERRLVGKVLSNFLNRRNKV